MQHGCVYLYVLLYRPPHSVKSKYMQQQEGRPAGRQQPGTHNIQQEPQERDEDKEVNTCPELDALIPNTVKVTSGATSKSLIVMGERSDRSVFMKISFAPKAGGDNSLTVEGRIYQLLTEMEFPFSIHAVASTTYEGFETMLKGVPLEERYSVYSDIRKALRRLKISHPRLTSQYNTESANLLITEMASGLTLYDYMRSLHKRTAQPSEWVPILAQGLFSVAYFEKLGIMHNDLHAQNAYVNQGTPVRYHLYYLDGADPFIVTTCQTLKIFDFDRASKASTVVNTEQVFNDGLEKNDYCKDYGQCNRFVAGADLAMLQILFWMDQLAPSPVRKFIRKVIDVDKANKQNNPPTVWNGFPCLKGWSADTQEGCGDRKHDKYYKSLIKMSPAEALKLLTQVFTDTNQAYSCNAVNRTSIMSEYMPPADVHVYLPTVTQRNRFVEKVQPKHVVHGETYMHPEDTDMGTDLDDTTTGGAGMAIEEALYTSGCVVS